MNDRPDSPDCAVVREAISARLDGEAPPPGASDPAAHLDTCAECRSYSAALEMLHRTTRVRPAEAIPDIASQVLAASVAPEPRPGDDIARQAGPVHLRSFPRVAFLTASAAAAILIVAVLGARVLESDPVAAADVSFTSAYATVTPDGEMASVYLSLKNAGGPDDLVAASSPAATETTLHGTQAGDGYTIMTSRTDYPIPAGTTIAFQPGGAHVMLEGLAEDLKPGDSVPITLTFAQSPPMEVNAVVVPMTDIYGYVAPVGPLRRRSDRSAVFLGGIGSEPVNESMARSRHP